MRDRVEQTEWCDRVREAIIDGRILEDPGFWKPHVEKCSICRPRVEGLLTLRRLMERARQEAPVVVVTPEQNAKMLAGVFERFRRHRRRRRTAGCVVAALLVGGGVFALTRPDASVESRAGGQDPVAYAQSLHRRVYANPRRPDYRALHDDAALRAEFTRALDDPSSLVRRTALAALMGSGVDVDPSRVEAALAGWHEDVETPIEVASASGPSRALDDAVEARRNATIRAALSGSIVAAAQGRARVSAAAIERFLFDRDPAIRFDAMTALALDASYTPGEAVLRSLRADADARVRVAAADCLVRRLGAAGARSVIAQLRAAPDAAVEVQEATALARFPDEGLPFARERLASPATSPRARIAHALALFRAGERVDPERVAAPALSDGGPEALFDLAALAAEADWASLRERLQAAWRALAQSEPLRGNVSHTLAAWDLKSGDAARAQLALDVCEADRGPRLREIVVALAASGPAAVRERAQSLLNQWPAK
jgi:hypothetical protein